MTVLESSVGWNPGAEDVDDGSTVVYNFFGGITRAFLRFYF